MYSSKCSPRRRRITLVAHLHWLWCSPISTDSSVCCRLGGREVMAAAGQHEIVRRRLFRASRTPNTVYAEELKRKKKSWCWRMKIRRRVRRTFPRRISNASQKPTLTYYYTWDACPGSPARKPNCWISVLSEVRCNRSDFRAQTMHGVLTFQNAPAAVTIQECAVLCYTDDAECRHWYSFLTLQLLERNRTNLRIMKGHLPASV
jgi:hypothetical protein